DLEPSHHTGQGGGPVHGGVVDGDDEVALAQRGVVGWAARLDADHLGAAVDGAVGRCAAVGAGHADEGVVGGAVLTQLVGDHRGGARRDREAQPDAPGLPIGVRDPRDRGVDADHLAGGVHQRTAGVAGVDRGVGLHGGGGGRLRGPALLATGGDGRVDGGDDAGGGGVLEPQGGAERHHRLAHLDGRGVREGGGLQALRRRVQTDHGQVRGGIGADDGGGVAQAVAGGDPDLPAVGDDVVVGEDGAVLV